MTELAPGIISDPSIHFGKPVIKGTRVPAEIVVSHIASGISVKDVAKEYGITEQDVYNALNYAAKQIANEHILPSAKTVSSFSGRFFYPNKFGLIHIQALEGVVGKPSFERILTSAGLSRYTETQSRMKLDNLEKGFDFAQISVLCAALDDFYGVPTGIDLARKVGESGFLIGLQNFGSLYAVAKLLNAVLPYQTKLRMNLKSAAKIVSQVTDQTCVVEENEHEFLWKIQECPYCLGRTSNTPICYMFGGFLDGLVAWATGNKHLIEERTCKARGDQVCEFSIKKKSLS
jgi:uncharacterized protein (DUF433 family)/predicted hydrocarbon binding protein